MKPNRPGEVLRKDLASKIEQLQAAYDAEMVKYLDLQRRIADATKLGRGGAETAFLERELDVVQRDRRDVGEQISRELQEWRDVDSPTIDEEFASTYREAQARHRELSEQMVGAHRALAKLAASGKSQTEEATALRERVLALQEDRAAVEGELTTTFKDLEALRNESAQRTTLPGTGRQAQNQEKGLIRQRHPNRDFFLADMFDYAMKDDGASMEAPIFTLSTKPDLSIWQWTSKDGNKSIRVAPSVLGRATQHDKDVLIYVVSQLTEALNRGREDAQNRTIRFTVYDFLVTTNRDISGTGYKRLHEAFERLAGTRISTDIKTGGQRTREGFGIIDRWKIIEKSPSDERMIAVEVTLSEWLYNAVQAFEVLTIHTDYFRLRKPLARRLYEIARKHCGHQTQWAIGLDLLQAKAGSKSTLKEFRRAVRAIEADDSLPDYRFVVGHDDKVTFYVRDGARLVRGLAKKNG